MDKSNTPAPEEQSFTPDTTGSSLPAGESYEIDPEDQPLADQLLNFDPVYDTKGPVQWIGGNQKPPPEQFKVQMLSPEMRDEVNAKLANVPLAQRDARESQLVYEALYQNSLRLRIVAGPGEGATETQKARLGIAGDRHNLQKEMWRIESELGEVQSWHPVFNEAGERVIDPETGQQKVKAVEVIQGDRRQGLQNRIAEIAHQIALLDGPEGDIRERKAIKADIDRIKSQASQMEEEQAARAKADEIVRQERIDTRANAYAKRKRSSV